MKIEVSTAIERPPAVVFDFVGTNHVKNHPRWDPTIELEQVTPGAIGVGTVIRRRTSRGQGPVEGSMRFVEWEPDRVMATVIHDGPLEMRSRMVIEPAGAGASNVTIFLDVPSLTEPMDPAPIERSLANIRRLIESET